MTEAPSEQGVGSDPDALLLVLPGWQDVGEAAADIALSVREWIPISEGGYQRRKHAGCS